MIGRAFPPSPEIVYDSRLLATGPAAPHRRKRRRLAVARGMPLQKVCNSIVRCHVRHRTHSMSTLRRSSRVITVAWLVCQVAWLTALVPRDCCAAHRAAEEGCHEAMAAPHCPMRSADGTACPMHRERSQPETPIRSSDCRISGACDGPLAALVLSSGYGTLAQPPALIPDSGVRGVTSAVHRDIPGRLQPPDPPPPRA
jgi:hypothetical protein